MKCWRRYRFGGWVSMRDDTPCSTLDEFYGISAFPEYGRNLITAAQSALQAEGTAIHGGVGIGEAPDSSKYRGAMLEHEGRLWAACETPLVKANAQLLDATIAYKQSVGAERAVAILHSPDGVEGDSGASAEYLDRYRSAAWHGFGIAWVTADRLEEGWKVSPVRVNSYRHWLDDLVHDLQGRLNARQVDPERLTSSKEAEKVVRPAFEELLIERGFAPTTRRYQTFWRSADSDGAWQRGTAGPNLVALEVKLDEDIQAPFCQVVENLGRADAVVQVRCVKRSTRQKLRELEQSNPWLPPLKARVEDRLPVRFVEM